jgi:hypothetical protein
MLTGTAEAAQPPLRVLFLEGGAIGGMGHFASVRGRQTARMVASLGLIVWWDRGQSFAMFLGSHACIFASGQGRRKVAPLTT